MSGSAHTDLDIVIPVHNEQSALEASVRMLHGYLSRGFPFSWQITIVDDASTDGTLRVARRLTRGPGRELISRAHDLLPLVQDDEWFFDTELLVHRPPSGKRPALPAPRRPMLAQ